MDINNYISSGSLEAYILGLATPSESAELKSLMEQNPGIREAVDAYWLTLEKLALEQAQAPPSGFREGIWNTIGREHGSPKALQERTLPASGERHMSSNLLSRYLVAASLFFLAGSLALNLLFFSRNRDLTNHMKELASSQQNLRARNRKVDSMLQGLSQTIRMIKDPAMMPVILEGVASHPGMMATLYWNRGSGDLYLSVNKLPPAPAGKQYQLWAMVDGKPVSAGICRMEVASTSLQKMPPLHSRAQAFAITLEQAGGSPVPTLSALYVKGKA